MNLFYCIDGIISPRFERFEALSLVCKNERNADMQNAYDQVLQGWKTDLIIMRARKKGFREDELDDVQQEVIQAVLGFRFDSARSNGSTEAATLARVVDKQVAFIQRRQARLRKWETERCDLGTSVLSRAEGRLLDRRTAACDAG